MEKMKSYSNSIRKTGNNKYEDKGKEKMERRKREGTIENKREHKIHEEGKEIINKERYKTVGRITKTVKIIKMKLKNYENDGEVNTNIKGREW
jgi:hypothetical protein